MPWCGPPKGSRLWGVCQVVWLRLTLLAIACGPTNRTFSTCVGKLFELVTSSLRERSLFCWREHASFQEPVSVVSSSARWRFANLLARARKFSRASKRNCIECAQAFRELVGVNTQVFANLKAWLRLVRAGVSPICRRGHASFLRTCKRSCA